MTDKDPQKEVGTLVDDLKERVQQLEKQEKKYMNRFKIRHKVIFSFIVFFGINLLWYGMWSIVSELPLIQDPVISLIVGAVLLILTGCFYDNILSFNFAKRKAKKKIESNTPKPPSKKDN